jgi:hypothetical protein
VYRFKNRQEEAELKYITSNINMLRRVCGSPLKLNQDNIKLRNPSMQQEFDTQTLVAEK